MSAKASVLNRLKGWRFSGTPAQGECLDRWPCDYWNVCRERIGTVRLHDPLYGTRRDFEMFAGEAGGVSYTFAFAEVSNGVFAVFERA